MAFLLPGIDPADQEIPLEADAPADARLSWFVGGEFLGSTPASQRLWWTPSPGEHTFVVTDESGRSASRTFAVRSRP